MCRRPMDEDSHKACKPHDSFWALIFFFFFPFFISYLYDAKNMLPGLSFFLWLFAKAESSEDLSS